MAQHPRTKLFNEAEPELTTNEIVESGEAGGRVVSLKVVHFLMPDKSIRYLGVKLVLENGQTPVILLDQLAANALNAVVDATNKISWDGASLLPPSTKH